MPKAPRNGSHGGAQRLADLNDHAASGSVAPGDEGFFGKLWDRVNPFGPSSLPDAGESAVHGAIGRTVQAIVGSHADQAHQAFTAWHNGDHVEAFGHGLAAVTPVVGPVAANIAAEGGDASIMAGRHSGLWAHE